MFSKDVWQTCEPHTARTREWTNREEEKAELLNPQWSTWRKRVCEVGVEIALAIDDAFAREVQGLTI